jgi:hypothetical protein
LLLRPRCPSLQGEAASLQVALLPAGLVYSPELAELF